jgi:hypothetical protein
MRFLSDLLRSRVLPAIVAALGVSFIAAGLLTYTTGADADLFPFPSDGIALAPSDSAGPDASDPLESPDPSASVAPDISPDPSDSPDPGDSAAPSDSFEPSDSAPPSAPASPIPSASGSFDVLPTDLASGLPLDTPAPTATAKPTPKPTTKPKPTPTTAPTTGKRTATRVVIPALDIDLPVVRPPGGSTTYPLCNVAMYIQTLSQPGYGGATYLYAHARVGMFLPLLDQSKINNGKGMIGMLVQVYTSDNQYFIYQISEVRRHQLTLADAIAAKDQELWLQTSEGPRGTPGKLQVIATPLSNGPADPKDAHPTPHPVVCG